MKHLSKVLPAMLTVLLIASCGGGASDGDTQAQAGSDQAAVEGPDQLADEIAENYLECMDELEGMLAERPDPETLKPMLADLTDRYIEVFVDLGHQVATYDSSTVDEIGRGVMSHLYGREIEWMTEASSYYHAMDTEVSGMIGELNIITQYAFFDLLRDQRPSEAERLGLTD